MSCTKISKYISKTRHQRCFTTIYELLQILESQDLKGHVYFGPCLPKFTKVIFSFPKFESSVCKNQLNSSLYLWYTADLRVQWPRVPSSFLTMPTQILSNQRLVSTNLYWHAKKNQAFWSICSRDIVDLKILQFDWRRAFWPICQKTDFSEIWGLCSNTANNKLSL